MSSSVSKLVVPYLSKNARIIKETNGLLALEKPPGVLAHPNELVICRRPCLFSTRFNFKSESYLLPNITAQSETELWLLNRLDYPTSGVILASMNRNIALQVRKMFQLKQVTKRYYALVFGNKQTFLRQCKSMAKLQWTDQMQSRSSHGQKAFASTSAQLISANPRTNTLLLELSPQTGFKNQLRYQCAKHGFPIVGDRIYGNFALNKLFPASMHHFQPDNSYTDLNSASSINRLFLHSQFISFVYEHDREVLLFEAECPIPDIFFAPI